jgi:hypothetical protein
VRAPLDDAVSELKTVDEGLRDVAALFLG